MSQINITQRPHASKDRATQWILQLPPVRGAVKAKSCGSITFYASRWPIAATEGNVMINANSTITRCVRIALTSLCSEITTPLGYDTRPSSSIPTAPTLTPPSNLSEAIDQCVGFLDPIQAAALLALKPDATAPGDASKMQSLFTNLLQHKSSTPTSKRTSTNSR